MVNAYTPISNETNRNKDDLKIFLAGTIDMGNSEDWQKKMINKFKRTFKDKNISLFNPRRPAKTGSTTSSFNLEEQIKWELDHLEEADYIIMYIIGTSKSPISLLELGLFAHYNKVIVICENDYYRYENVRVTCNYYNVPLLTSLNDFYKQLI